MRDTAPGSRGFDSKGEPDAEREAGKFGASDFAWCREGWPALTQRRALASQAHVGLGGSGRRADSLGQLLYVLSAAPVPPGTRGST